MSKSSWRSAAREPITRRCGVGCSVMARNWNSGCGYISSPLTKSWRVDETYLKVKGRWCYLYRAIDSAGATIDFLLLAFRDADAAKRLFRKALSGRSHPQPRVINTDLAPINTSAIPAIKKEWILRRRCRHRPVHYLNNIIEQDHRPVKRRVNAQQGFREFQAARRTIQGYDATHMIAEGTDSMGERDGRSASVSIHQQAVRTSRLRPPQPLSLGQLIPPDRNLQHYRLSHAPVLPNVSIAASESVRFGRMDQR
jgi:transposase-like protein